MGKGTRVLARLLLAIALLGGVSQLVYGRGWRSRAIALGIVAGWCVANEVVRRFRLRSMSDTARFVLEQDRRDAWRRLLRPARWSKRTRVLMVGGVALAFFVVLLHSAASTPSPLTSTPSTQLSP
jgi:hypothetical protein